MPTPWKWRIREGAFYHDFGLIWNLFLMSNIMMESFRKFYNVWNFWNIFSKIIYVLIWNINKILSEFEFQNFLEKFALLKMTLYVVYFFYMIMFGLSIIMYLKLVIFFEFRIIFRGNDLKFNFLCFLWTEN